VYNFFRCLSCRSRDKGKNTIEHLSAGEWGAEIETSDDWWVKLQINILLPDSFSFFGVERFGYLKFWVFLEDS